MQALRKRSSRGNLRRCTVVVAAAVSVCALAEGAGAAASSSASLPPTVRERALSPSDTQPIKRLTPAGTRAARAAVLQAGDFPGWKRDRTGSNDGGAECATPGVDKSRLVLNGEAQTQFALETTDSYAAAGSKVGLFAEPRMAEALFRGVKRAAVAACMKRQLVTPNTGTRVEIGATRLLPLRAGTERAADLRIAMIATSTQQPSTKVRVFFDVLILQHRRMLAFAYYISMGKHDQEQVTRLAGILGSRVRAAAP